MNVNLDIAIYHTPNELSISTHACGFLVVTIMVITMITKRSYNTLIPHEAQSNVIIFSGGVLYHLRIIS